MNSNSLKSVSKSIFRLQLERNISDTIKTLRKEGTTAMGLDCLRANTPTPSYFSEGAPKGTNCQWVYAQMFEETVKQNPAFARFASL